MKNVLIPSFKTLVYSGVALAVFSTAAFAQRAPRSAPKHESARADTWQMTCGQSKSMVKGENGVVLKSGPNHFDRYVNSGFACETGETLEPAFVRTKDTSMCYVGFTCEDTERE